jgi:long-chain acyl-CoA synthetase
VNVAGLVAEAAARDPRRVAVVGADGPTATWGGLARRTAAVAGAVHARGIERGDRLAVVLPNGIHFAAVYWGALRAGAAVVPVNPAYTPPEIAHLLGDSGARMAVAHPALVPVVRQAAAALTPPPAVLVPDQLDGPLCEEPVGGGRDVAVVCYTSGTTGRPKGAVLTHANLLANLTSISRLPRLRLDPSDVLLGVLPFFHIFGLNVILNAAAQHAASVVALDRFSPTASLQVLARHHVTVAYGAPPVYAAWNAVAASGGAPHLPALRAAVSGADALPVTVWREFADRFGVEILEGYGLTETAPVVASNAASPSVRPGAVGHPIPGVRVGVVDTEGRHCSPDQVGEIVVAGPNVFDGYFGQPAATEEVCHDGWFHTGDLGSFDTDGYLTIAGRLKEMVIVSGFNVYPKEVEAALLDHPAIADAAVFGLPDPRTGERVHALVVARPGATIAVDRLLDHCRSRLARYKLPRAIEVVEDLPRLSSGKLPRRMLQAEAARLALAGPESPGDTSR